MSLYVGNLSFEVGQEDLSSIFAEYGSCSAAAYWPKQVIRGFGFVEMGTEAEDAAIEAHLMVLNGWVAL